MKFMIIFNFITNLLISLYLLYAVALWRISFTWDKTFWTEKRSGFTVWWKINYHSQKRIFHIRFISKKKEEQIEEEYVNNNLRRKRVAK